MSRNPIETAQKIWNTLNRGLDRATLVVFIVGMVGIPVLLLLDALGVVDLFDGPAWWSLFGAAFMSVGGVVMLTQWLCVKLAQTRALSESEEGGQ